MCPQPWCSPHSPDPGTGDLYSMDDSQLVSDKSSLEEPPDLGASPPLHAGSFSLLPASPSPAPLLHGPGSPPALPGTCGPGMLRCPPRGLDRVAAPGAPRGSVRHRRAAQGGDARPP